MQSGFQHRVRTSMLVAQTAVNVFEQRYAIESISNRHFPLLCQVSFQNGFMFMPFFRDETVENTDQHPS